MCLHRTSNPTVGLDYFNLVVYKLWDLILTFWVFKEQVLEKDSVYYVGHHGSVTQLAECRGSGVPCLSATACLKEWRQWSRCSRRLGRCWWRGAERENGVATETGGGRYRRTTWPQEKPRWLGAGTLEHGHLKFGPIAQDPVTWQEYIGTLVGSFSLTYGNVFRYGHH